MGDEADQPQGERRDSQPPDHLHYEAGAKQDDDHQENQQGRHEDSFPSPGIDLIPGDEIGKPGFDSLHRLCGGPADSGASGKASVP